MFSWFKKENDKLNEEIEIRGDTILIPKGTPQKKIDEAIQKCINERGNSKIPKRPFIQQTGRFQRGGIVPAPTKSDNEKIVCPSVQAALFKNATTESIMKTINNKENKMSSMIIQEQYNVVREAMIKIKKENDSLFIITLDAHNERVKEHEELKKQLKKAQESSTYWAKAFEGLQEEHNELARKTFAPVVSNLMKSTRNVCSQAVRTFGHTIQIYVATEEMGELIQALSKDLRGQGNQKNITEEIADVAIMLHQLKLIYGITEAQLNTAMFHKLDKLEQRIIDYKGRK